MLSLVFRLGYEILTTDLIAGELKSLNVDRYQQIGLKVRGLPGTAMNRVFRMYQQGSGPSVNDYSALILAQDERCQLVTRDGPLTSACRDERVAVRDTLWLIRKMVVAGLLTQADAADALEVINQTRLARPNPDWTTQIRKWRR